MSGEEPNAGELEEEIRIQRERGMLTRKKMVRSARHADLCIHALGHLSEYRPQEVPGGERPTARARGCNSVYTLTSDGFFRGGSDDS